MKTLCASIAACIFISGCAVPPGTPGAGYGKNYTPVIDTQGVDNNRYTQDLGDCRQFAGIIDEKAAAMKGLIGGILLGALVGAAAGSRSGNAGFGANYGATVGGTSGVFAGEGRAAAQQERILINCMAGRGYRTLDGSATANANYPSPYLSQRGQVGFSTGAPLNVAPGTTPTRATSSVYVYNPTPLVNPAAVTAPAPPISATSKLPSGSDAVYAQRFSVTQACSSEMPILAAKGPGFETYSAACGNGDTIMIRCEWGTCRALQ